VAVHKLLLLGAGESGKSTLFKQMIQIYGKGFNEKDRKSYIPIVYRNIIACIQELCKRSNYLYNQDSVTYANCKVTSSSGLDSLKYLSEVKFEDGTLPHDLCRHIKLLWEDAAIQVTYTYRSKFQLNDNAKYFLDQIDDLIRIDYLPTDKDIIHARARTTGIIENDFIIDHNKFKMVDVGGQRNERKKMDSLL